MEYLPSYTDSLYLAHHGIQGQRWGVRRYQNADGTRTSAGKKHERDLYGRSSPNISINDQYRINRGASRGKYINKLKGIYSDKNKNLKTKLQEHGEARKQQKRNVQNIKGDYFKQKSSAHKDLATTTEALTGRSGRDTADANRGLSAKEKAKSDVAYAKASGNKDSIKAAKKALRKINMASLAWGNRGVGAYKRYIDDGNSKAKAVLKASGGAALRTALTAGAAAVTTSANVGAISALTVYPYVR